MRSVLCALLFASVSVTASAPETYRVSVTRKDSNMYRIDGSKLFIKTKYCYEYVYGEQAILRYDKHAYDNKLIFDKRPRTVDCDVDKLLEEQ